MNLTITHHPAPFDQGIPASAAPEGTFLNVVYASKAVAGCKTVVKGAWCVRAGDKLWNLDNQQWAHVGHYRVVPLAVGARLVIERSE